MPLGVPGLSLNACRASVGLAAVWRLGGLPEPRAQQGTGRVMGNLRKGFPLAPTSAINCASTVVSTDASTDVIVDANTGASTDVNTDANTNVSIDADASIDAHADVRRVRQRSRQ